LLTRRQVTDRLVPVVCLLAPCASYVLSSNSVEWFGGYRFSYEILVVNALLTMAGLWAISKPATTDYRPV